jgi:hypothetical protein
MAIARALSKRPPSPPVTDKARPPPYSFLVALLVAVEAVLARAEVKVVVVVVVVVVVAVVVVEAQNEVNEVKGVNEVRDSEFKVINNNTILIKRSAKRSEMPHTLHTLYTN